MALVAISDLITDGLASDTYCTDCHLSWCIFIIPAPDEPEVKARIKHWIRRKKEAEEMDDLQGMEAYRLSVILVSQLKVRHSDFRLNSQYILSDYL